MFTQRKMLVLAISVSLLAIVAFGGLRVRAADDEIPVMLRQQLEAVLQKKVSDLVAEKNAKGYSYKRGVFSRNLMKVDDNTYTAVFHRDTAGDEQIKTERLLLTLKKDAAGKWSVAKEEVQDTYDGLYRVSPDKLEFYRFDKFVFDREGLKITATGGSLIKQFLMDKPQAVYLVAKDLAYEYNAPQYLDYYQMYRRVVLDEYKNDFVFKPKGVGFQCDPVSCEEILASAFTNLKKATKAETDPELQKRYDDEMKRLDDRLKDNGFAGFTQPFEADHRTWSFMVESDRRSKLAGLNPYAPTSNLFTYVVKDNHAGYDVVFGSSEYGEVYGYYSQELLKNSTAADLERRPDEDARDYEVASLKGTVEIALEDAEALKADVTYVLTLQRELRELPYFIFRLRRPGDERKETKNPHLIMSSIRDGEGKELTWVRTGPYSGLVVYPKPMPAGTKLTLRMQFKNMDSIYKLNPSFSIVDRIGWLPFVRFTDPIEEFYLTVKTPAKYQAIGVGRKVSEKIEDSVEITEWTSDHPVTFPTVIFGDYVSGTPKIKATKKDGSEITVNVWVDKVSTQSLDGTGINTRADVENKMRQADGGARGIRTGSLSAVGDQAVNAMNLYREVYGIDYPFSKLDLVADPMGDFYGQAPASIIYLGFGVFRGEGTVAAEFGGGADLSKFNKDVVAHETGHQWWGSSIGNQNGRNYWFIESITEYSCALYVENVRGWKAYLDKVSEWRRRILQFESLTSVQNASVLWGGEFPGAAYVANVYNKGPYAFHILRMTFGDQKFFNFLKMLGAELNGKQIVTADIQRISEQAFGGNMDWFWNQWIKSAGIPQFAVNWQGRATEDGKYLVEGTVKQRVVAGKKEVELQGVYYKARGFLTLVFPDGKEMKWPQSAKPGEPERMWIIDGAETAFKIKLPKEPTEVRFNTDGEILAKDVLEHGKNW
jgi:hypothetical protein